MGYRKRFEDSYLDEESEEFEASESDISKLLKYISEGNVAESEKLLIRFYNYSVMPGEPGRRALAGLERVAVAYQDMGNMEKGAEVWTKLLELAEQKGDKHLYFRAMENL